MKTLTPTIVIAVIALISPIITNWINNRHLEREKCLDFMNKHFEKKYDKKVDLIESFMRSSYELKQQIENISFENSNAIGKKNLLLTVKAMNYKDLNINIETLSESINSFNQNLAALLPLVSRQTSIDLLEFSGYINSGLSIIDDRKWFELSYSQIIDVLNKEISNSVPDYDAYRPKEINDIIFGMLKHINITKNRNKN